jgi:RNA recognition motif-containing protein
MVENNEQQNLDVKDELIDAKQENIEQQQEQHQNQTDDNNQADDDNRPLEPEQFRKLFIGALSLNTTDESLQGFYSQFGEIVDCVVMRDSNKKSRGFGFVAFAKSEQVDKAMAARPHTIDGKKVDPKRAIPKDVSQQDWNFSTKRMYVSGIRESHTEEMFQDYFSKYGEVDKVDIMTDKSTGKPRGFAFVNFQDPDSVDKCVLLRSHQIGGFRCDVKKAQSKDQAGRDKEVRSGRSRGPNPSRGGNSYGGGGGGQWDGPWAQPPAYGMGGGGPTGGWGPPMGGGGYSSGGYGGFSEDVQVGGWPQNQSSWGGGGGGSGRQWGGGGQKRRGGGGGQNQRY